MLDFFMDRPLVARTFTTTPPKPEGVWKGKVGAMKRWSLAAAAAGLLAVWTAAPAQAAEWCRVDPPVDIQTSRGESFTVYVTEGVMGPQHQAALAAAKVSYTARVRSSTSVFVVIYDIIPTDSYGTFATELVVSSRPFGGGVVYGSTYRSSGTTMSVSFWINPEKLKS
jgi:hypothetical protein